MPGEVPVIYWDSCILISYLDGDADRLPVIDEIFRRSRAGEIELVTSVMSQVEVAFIASEKAGGALDQSVEEGINELWTPASPLDVVEFHELIALRARDLIRVGLVESRALKPIDAVHLATAESLEASELQTYDTALQRWSGKLGFPVHDPQTPQAQLPGTQI